MIADHLILVLFYGGYNIIECPDSSDEISCIFKGCIRDLDPV